MRSSPLPQELPLACLIFREPCRRDATGSVEGVLRLGGKLRKGLARVAPAGPFVPRGYFLYSRIFEKIAREKLWCHFS